MEQHRITGISCRALPLNPFVPNSRSEPCTDLKCDGLLHVAQVPQGGEFYYLGSIDTSEPFEAKSDLETKRTESLTMQSIDEFGGVSCTTAWERVVTQSVDRQGQPVGRPIQTSETVGTKSNFDPIAISMQNQIEKSFTSH